MPNSGTEHTDFHEECLSQILAVLKDGEIMKEALDQVRKDALKREVKATLAIEGIHVSDETIDEVFKDAEGKE